MSSLNLLIIQSNPINTGVRKRQAPVTAIFRISEVVAFASFECTIKFGNLNFESRLIIIFHLRSYNWVFSTQHIASPKTRYLKLAYKSLARNCSLIYFSMSIWISTGYSKSNGFRHSLWGTSENIGCGLRRVQFLYSLSLFS